MNADRLGNNNKAQETNFIPIVISLLGNNLTSSKAIGYNECVLIQMFAIQIPFFVYTN